MGVPKGGVDLVTRLLQRLSHGVGLGLIISVLGASSGGAAEFLAPPEIGNRTVGLSWTADPDDAVFTGNIVLEVDEEYPFIHGADRPVVDVAAFNSVREFLSYAEGERELKRWSRDDGEIIQSLPIASPGNPVDLTIHGSNRYALAAYDDGSVELWDLEESPDSSRIAEISPLALHRVEFLSRVTDEADFRFVAAGEENLVYYMNAIGSVGFTMTVPGGGVEAIALSPDGSFLVTGGADARLRVWRIDDGRPDSPLAFFVTHQGTVRDIVIDPTSTRMASIDATGHVIISVLRTGQKLGEFDTDASEGAGKLAYSLPDGAVLSIAQGNGTITIRDGFTGREYRQRQVSTDGITAYTLGSDGLRSVVGDRDGRIQIARAGRCIPSAADPICFGGYKIWRNTVPDTSGKVLMREYRFDSDTWTLDSATHHFNDPDSLVIRVSPPGEEDEEDEIRRSGPHNGVPYFYSVTRFDRHYFQGQVADVNSNSVIDGFYRDPGADSPTPIVPTPDARTEVPELSEVYVVPNPYKSGEVPWDEIGGPHVEFRNLPEVATIKIFNVAGDFVRRIEHQRDKYGEARSSEPWNLDNKAGKQVTSGVYLYHIETPDGELIQGYFVIIL